MGYNLCMMNDQPLMLLSKKVASAIISVMILLNIFGVVLINNAENIEISNKYAANTITKYCNMAVMIPMKIVSSFFKINTSTDIGTTVPAQTSKQNKKSKKDNGKNFYQSAVVEDEASSLQFFKNLTEAGLVNSQYNYSNVSNTLFAVSIMLLFIVLFNGNMILARGDTEDIIIKKNINKIVRLV